MKKIAQVSLFTQNNYPILLVCFLIMSWSSIAGEFFILRMNPSASLLLVESLSDLKKIDRIQINPNCFYKFYKYSSNQKPIIRRVYCPNPAKFVPGNTIKFKFANQVFTRNQTELKIKEQKRNFKGLFVGLNRNFFDQSLINKTSETAENNENGDNIYEHLLGVHLGRNFELTQTLGFIGKVQLNRYNYENQKAFDSAKLDLNLSVLPHERLMLYAGVNANQIFNFPGNIGIGPLLGWQVGASLAINPHFEIYGQYAVINNELTISREVTNTENLEQDSLDDIELELSFQGVEAGIKFRF